MFQTLAGTGSERGRGRKIAQGAFGVCLLLYFFMQNYVRPFLCECVPRFEHEPLCFAPPSLLCLSHRLPSTRPFGSPRKSPSIFMPCIHVSVRVCIDIKFRTHQRARTTIFVFQSWRSHLMRPLPAVYTPRQLHNFVGLFFFF